MMLVVSYKMHFVLIRVIKKLLIYVAFRSVATSCHKQALNAEPRISSCYTSAEVYFRLMKCQAT